MGKIIARMNKTAARIRHGERGITGLETAIVLIAFVVVSSVFAFSALSTGLFSSDQAKETINQGLKSAQGTLEVRGTIIATDSDSDTTDIDVLTFQIANAAGGRPVDLTPGKTVVRYTDATQTLVRDASGEYTVTPLGSANANNLVEEGEIIEISIPNLATSLSTPLGVSTTFTIQVIPASGATLQIERRTPPVLAKYNDLN